MYSTCADSQGTQTVEARRLARTRALCMGRNDRAYRVCGRCVMDTSDPRIRFDTEGNCSHCEAALQRMRREIPPPDERAARLQEITETIKK